MKKAEPTICIFKRKNEAGEIVGWSASIKISGTTMWADVRHRNVPTDFYGSIYPTKEEAVEAARADIRAFRCAKPLNQAALMAASISARYCSLAFTAPPSLKAIFGVAHDYDFAHALGTPADEHALIVHSVQPFALIF